MTFTQLARRHALIIGLATLLASNLATGCKPGAKHNNGAKTQANSPDGDDRSTDIPPEKLPFTAAAALDGVQVVGNRDNAILKLPAVTGAKDYRAFRLPKTTTLDVSPGGEETVNGTTIYCAGEVQHNLPAAKEAEVLRQLQVNDLPVTTVIVVEAIDRQCPFVGVVGHTHHDVTPSAVEIKLEDRVPFSIYTESEVRGRYGSMIINGQAPGNALSAQAAPAAPKVLARTVLKIEPLKRDADLVKTFFDDFLEDEQPTKVADLDSAGRADNPELWQTSKWSLYTYGGEYSEFSIERGQLNMVLADYSQHVLASNIAYPRQPLHLDDASYAHITFEVQSDVTQRRFWWLSLCGAAGAGQTFAADGQLTSQIIPTPFFYDPGGQNPSLAGWNCLQIFPRDGWPFPIGNESARPESDMRVMVNLPQKPAGENVVNVSPDQYGKGGSTSFPKSWYRQWKGGQPSGVMLDDQLFVGERTRFDVYVRKDRVVLYVAGEQRLCNDLGPAKLGIGEAAVGFGQMLFHSSVERSELFNTSNDRTGQRYYIQNTPFVDARSWDNVGFEEKIAAPPGFDAGACYAYQ